MELKLLSPSFNDLDFLPDIFSGYGKDISPELHIEGIDPKAVSLVLTLDDADHPKIPNFNHWIAWNIGPVEVVPENLPKGFKNDKPIHIEQGCGYGWFRYRGPKTPKGETHIYVYTVYVLDIKLKASRFSNKKKILNLAEGHILQKAELRIRYTPNRQQ